MTAYEISIICISGFIALLFLIFVICVVWALVSFKEASCRILQDIEGKLNDLSPTFHLMNKVGACVDEKVERLCEEEEKEPNGWLDVAFHLASLAVAGAGLWEKHRKRRQ